MNGNVSGVAELVFVLLGTLVNDCICDMSKWHTVRHENMIIIIPTQQPDAGSEVVNLSQSCDEIDR